MNERLWIRWMLTGALVTELVGLVLAALAIFAPEVLVPITSLVFASLEPELVVAGPYRLMTGIAGGLMLGWGLTLHLALRDPRLREIRGLWTAVAFGVIAWFVVDGVASLASGAPLNVVGNIAFLALLLPPALGLRGGGT